MNKRIHFMLLAAAVIIAATGITVFAYDNAIEMPIIHITQEEPTPLSAPDRLSLCVMGRSFTVKAEGENAGEGVIVVALYDSKDLRRLLDVKLFDAKTAPDGSFDQDGFVKAFWWSSVEEMTPYCQASVGEAVGESEIPEETERIFRTKQ